MGRLLVGVTIVITIAAISAVSAQVPPFTTAPTVVPATTYPGAYRPYPFAAPTPSDAYRQGLINRWELEQFEGPTPQAYQGPSPNGSRNFD